MSLSNSKIYFNEAKHIYTNEVGNKYISATTIIGKYEVKFEDKQNQIARACAKIGKNPRHPKYLKYKGMSASQILAKWDRARIKGCDIGNTKHNYLETSVKEASSFYSVFGSKYKSVDPNTPVLLYTIENVIDNPNSGKLDLDYFVSTGVKDKYPKIYTIVEAFVNDGWRIYSEVAVFHNGFLISGLIDILLVKDKHFVILDWKTNKDDVKFESGYWEKDNNDITTIYKPTDDTFKYPLHQLPLSTGNKYALQLSLYAFLVEEFGLTHIKNILCHIRYEDYKIGDKDVEANPDWVGKNKVDILNMPYLKKDIQSLVYDYSDSRTGQQSTMF